MAEDVSRKAELRTLACHLRRLIPPHAREAGSFAASARLLALPELADARTVLAYAAAGDEIDPSSALASLRARGARIAYPRVEGSELSLRLVEDAATLAPATFGIPEPSGDAPRVEPAEVDAVIVPGVAFDPSCARLGHGAGYYDRLLPALRPGTPMVGLAFDEQVLDEVPSEPHDVRMDVVVTPSAVYRRG